MLLLRPIFEYFFRGRGSLAQSIPQMKTRKIIKNFEDCLNVLWDMIAHHIDELKNTFLFPLIEMAHLRLVTISNGTFHPNSRQSFTLYQTFDIKFKSLIVYFIHSSLILSFFYFPVASQEYIFLSLLWRFS